MAVSVPPGFYRQLGERVRNPTNKVEVGTVPTSILDFSPDRLGAVITNDDSVTIYVGPKDYVADGRGHALLAGNSLSVVSSADVWGNVPAGTAHCTTYEELAR